MSRNGRITPVELEQLAHEVDSECGPFVFLVRNEVGNLAIISQDSTYYLGYIELGAGVVAIFEEPVGL